MAISGVVYSYTTGGQGAVTLDSLEQVISMISPEETPLFTMLETVPAINTKHEWVEDALRGMTDTLAAAMTIAAVTMRVGNAASRIPCSTNYPVLIRVDEEYMEAYLRTTNKLTVVRGYNSTSSAAHSSSATVEIIADLGLEGGDARTALAQTRTRPYNMTQFFDGTIQVSDTQQAVESAGVVNTEADYQAAMQMKNLKIQVEKSLVNGTRVVGSTSTFRAMGGLWHYISTNKTNASSASVTEANIMDDAKKCFDAGGKPSVLMCNSAQMRKINDLYGSRIRTTPENIFGGINVSRILCPFAAGGELVLIPNQFVAQHEYYILDMGKLKKAALIPFRTVDIARTGSAVKMQVQGEYTLVCKNESAHARRYGLATT
jgi:hypothetical protein